MKLGTSVRFLFPTSPATHERFRSLLASMPKGAFIERPMGAYAADEQARNLMEVAAAARAAGLDGLLTGDSHSASADYAATFSPLPTIARLMSVTGDMPVGVVLLAPFYHPLLLAEQIGTLAAFAAGPLIITFVLGGRPQQFQAFGMEERSRVGRLEETVPVVRALLAGERVTPPGPPLHAGERHDQSPAARPRGDLARRDGPGVRRARGSARGCLADRAERDRRRPRSPARPLPERRRPRAATRAPGPAPRHLRRRDRRR